MVGARCLASAPTTRQALVVGGGIGGLATAGILELVGWQVLRRTRPHPAADVAGLGRSAAWASPRARSFAGARCAPRARAFASTSGEWGGGEWGGGSTSIGGVFERTGKQAGRWYDVWRIGKDGSRQRAPISHQQLLSRASLFPRDLLTFDVSSDAIKESSTTGSRPPRILVREHAILLTAGHLRCVVRQGEIFLFDADRPMVADFARRLEAKLTRSHAVESAAASNTAHWSEAGANGGGSEPLAADDALDEDSGERERGGSFAEAGAHLYPLAAPFSPHLHVPPFEMRALDLVLEEVTAAYARRAALLSPMVDTLLSRLVADVSPYSAEGLGLNNISMLLPLRDSLNGFELEATELIGVLVGLLDSDEDMLDMLLTEKAALRGKRPPAAHHEPVELLLEEYARQMATVLTEAQALKKRVASASELAQLHLDISRNRMVSMNVHLSMVNTSLALIMTSAGVFGMNLTSGMENSSDAFYAVTAISSLAAGCTLATCWSYLHGFRGSGRSQQLSLQLQSSNAVRRVFRNLDSLQFVLANKLGPTPSSLPDEGAGAGGGGAGTEDGAAAPGAAVSVASLKRELEHASGHTMSSAELTLLLRLLEREDIHDAPVPRSQIAALWQRFALPREMWSPSEPSPLARPPALDGKKAPAAGAPPVAGAATAHGVPPAAPPAGKLPGKK